MKTSTQLILAALATGLLNHIATAAAPFTVAAVTGDPVPGFASGALFIDLGQPVINDRGEIAFIGAAAGGDATAGTNSGVFLRSDPNTIDLLVRQGSDVPGIASTTFSAFSPRINIDATGRVVFMATISGTGVVSTNNSVLCQVTPGDPVQVLAREGDAIAGTAFSFGAGAFEPATNSFVSPLVQAGGFTVFYGKLSGPGNALADGVFLHDGTDLAPIALTGQTIDLSGTAGDTGTFARPVGGQTPAVLPISTGQSFPPQLGAANELPSPFTAGIQALVTSAGGPRDGAFVCTQNPDGSFEIDPNGPQIGQGFGVSGREVFASSGFVGSSSNTLLLDLLPQNATTNQPQFNRIYVITTDPNKPGSKPKVITARDTAAPGIPGSRLSFFGSRSTGRRKLSAFKAGLFNPLKPSQIRSAFFLDQSGVGALGVSEGTQCPDSTSGVKCEQLGDTIWGNDCGQFATECTLSGTGITTGENDSTLLVSRRKGTGAKTKRVVTTGDTIALGTGINGLVIDFSMLDLPTDGCGSNGFPQILNNNGQLCALVECDIAGAPAKAVGSFTCEDIPVYQPDLSFTADAGIGFNDPRTGGQHIYEVTPVIQKQSYHISKDAGASFFITLSNAGNRDDTFRLDFGNASASIVSITDNGTGITAQAIAGFDVDIPVGESRTYRLTVLVTPPATFNPKIKAVSLGSGIQQKTDALKLKFTAS